jgi:hypothetical protein
VSDDNVVDLHKLRGRSTDTTPDDNTPDDIAVKSFDGGKHYVVMFTLKGQTVALEPDEARHLAEDLHAAATKADEQMG